MVFHRLGWQRILIEGESGAGKSAHAKDIVVRTSKNKKICIFSLKGEWEKQVTEYSNYYNADKQKLTNYKVLADYSIKISDFKDTDDWISLGFTEMGCSIIAQLVRGGRKYYEDDPKKFQRLLNALPIREVDYKGNNLLNDYEEEFGIELNSAIFPQIKQSIILRFVNIKEWFWFPEDERPYYDFIREWILNDHLIINISDNKYKARALCGSILKKLKPHHKTTRGLFVFEEGRVLFPVISKLESDLLLPSSIKEIYDILTMGRKEGVAILVITQREEQLYEPSRAHFFAKIIIGKFISTKNLDKMEYRLALGLKWDPNAGSTGYRTALIYYKTGRWSVYEPRISCCKS